MKITLRDFFFSPSAGREGGPSVDPQVRQAAMNGKGLKITFVASHGGMVNGNDVMYSPRGIEDCLHTWVYPQQRPFQIHHDDMADPIGRVIGARFVPFTEVQTAQDGTESKSSHVKLADAVFDKLADSDKKDKNTVVEAAKALEALGVLGADSWRGTGELVLDAVITDAAAIEKILDGRYQGISIGQRPREAFCSLCGTDWISSDEVCQHHRGEIDKETGRKMYLIVGKTKYSEASAVNSPADEFAKITASAPVDAPAPTMTDCTIGNLDKPGSLMLFDAFDDEADEVIETSAEIIPSAEVVPSELVIEPVVEPIPEPVKDAEPAEEPKEEPQEPVVEEKPLSEAVQNALEILFSKEEELTEEQAELINEALEEEVSETDAKLSTEKRKSLPSSSFCGPNKSFPCPDCAHVTAARRLVGRYKGPGDKKKILACVSRKAKALGCDGDSQDSGGLCLDCLTDADLQQTLRDAETLLDSRGIQITRECNSCKSKDVEILSLQAKVLEETGRTNILREEWDAVRADYTTAETTRADNIAELEKVLSRMVVISLLLTDKEQTPETIETAVRAMSLDELRDNFAKIDLNNVISFVRSGLSNEPEGTVSPKDAEIKVEPIKTLEFAESAETLVNFAKNHGRNFAERYLVELKRFGKVPPDFTLAKAFDVVVASNSRG